MGGRVLVLNATYEPINVCTVRRAVVLLLKEKAELLERGPTQLHSETSTLARPVVIRLVTYVRVPRDAHRRKITRRAVFARDSWTCQYCGSRSNLTVDHVIPRSKGGLLELGEHRGLVRAVQPPQGRPHAPPGGHAPPPRAPLAAGGDLHPRREPDDPGGLAAVPAPGGLAAAPGGAAGARAGAARREAAPRRGPECTRGAALQASPLAMILDWIDRDRPSLAGGTRTGGRLGVSRVGFR